MIDWDEFAKQLPPGTAVKIDWVEGLLMESFPFYAFEWNIVARAEVDDGDYYYYPESCIRWQRTNVQSQYTGWTLTRAERLQYFIRGEWLTFIQVFCQ